MEWDRFFSAIWQGMLISALIMIFIYIPIKIKAMEYMNGK